MSVTAYARDDRPVREPEDPYRAAMARRSLSRWALRLALREWKQRILIVLLITVATAATLLGIAVASATPGTPNAGTFGTARALVELPGTTHGLAGAIARIERAYGPASVVDDEPIATGQAGGADLRAQDPGAPYTRVLLALDSGRYPSAPGQAAVTPGLAQLYSLRIGSTWHVPATALPGAAGAAAGRAFTVTGIVENLSNLLDEFALVPPGQLTAPGDVRIFLGESLDSAAASKAGDVIPKNANVSAPAPDNSPVSPATVVLVVSVLGLVFIGLVATAAFTVMAQRRQRALGMLASLGATEKDVRFVLTVDGLVAGVAGAVVGAAAAAGAWFWYYPHLETATAHRTDPLALPWAAVVIGLLLAVATSVLAAVWPGRAVSRIPVVAAISERVEPPQVVGRSLRPGVLFLVGGLFLLFVSGGWDGGADNSRFLIIIGLICCEVASALLAPFIVDRLSRLAWRAPLATRLAVRDLERYRSRSGAALAAISFAVFIATISIIIASVRFDDALDYTAPNMAPNQLILYAPGNDPTQNQTGQFTPAAKLAAARAGAAVLAAQLHAPAPLELDVPVSVNVPMSGQPAENQYGGVRSMGSVHGGFGGLMYVATPALLKAFGIGQGEVNPAADVLTMRAGLPSTGNLALVSGAYLAESPNSPCPAGMCVLNPVIQEVSKLPAGTAVPNSVITENAVKALHETAVPVGWLVTAPSALTAVQVNAARQAALGLGATVETKSGQLSLGQISNGATAGGLLLALGVLAMTAGLIRGETARDLRTLTATGAGARTRRALAGVTAGVLGFLGAALGTVAALLAGAVWAHSSLIQTFGNVPWSDIGLLVVGMPLAGAVGGWLLGGRQPSAVSRQPLE
jgi:putative ABC transport system permease protein